MLINTHNILAQIQQAKQKWQGILPQVATSTPGANDVLPAFEEMTALLEKLPEEIEIDGIAWGMAQSQLSALVQHSGTIPNAPSVPAWLWGFKNAFLDALPLKYVAKKRSSRTTKQLEARIDLLESHLERVENAKDRIDSIAAHWDELERRVEALSESFETTHNEITDLKQAAFEATDEVQSAAKSVKTQVAELGELLQEIQDGAERQQSLFKEFEEKRDQIEAYLKNANKVGLAKSFQDKRRELTWIWRAWATIFVFGIILLTLFGWFHILPLVEKGISLEELGARVVLVSPLIWLAWFAAVQYSRLLRLSEDYAFKEAAAMAYVGYRDEMGNDPELVKLLQKYAIQNFGENPSKLLLKHTEAVSPVHDLVSKACSRLANKSGD